MLQATAMMESNLSMLSSLKEEFKSEDFIQPHYKESYRLAIDALVSGGRNIYREFIKAERIGAFLSEEEIFFITENAEQPSADSHSEDIDGPPDNKSSTGTYWPTHSDVATPDLELGWPEHMQNSRQTNIDLLFHPPRHDNPTIKEVVRKYIQNARQVIAIAMDVFTDVDVFKEIVDASLRGVPVYVLLDESQFKSFLTMAENHDVQIPKLRNMRVRTVKGQDYLCRSGVKFHGAMEQRFLLVDCQTAVYGSYSFMWSYEKINLSMVQVITGQLVESYDEEFRTLYARSTVPAELLPLESVSPDKRLNGKMERYSTLSSQPFERRDQLRHTLDAVYRKACERQVGIMNPMGDITDRLHEPFNHKPMINQDRFNPFHAAESTNFHKRHSYAGERQETSYIPNHQYGASNWNVSGDRRCQGALGRNQFSSAMEDQHQATQMNQIYRGSNMPSLEHTTKSFMRTWRIESYLNNTEAPIGDSYDYLDQSEVLDSRPGPFMSSRLRSSLVFKSTIPEQPETNSYSNISSSSTLQGNQCALPNNTQLYSMQWNRAGPMESQIKHDEFMLKRRSLQILDDPRQNMTYGSGRDPYHSVYASLGTTKGRLPIKDHEVVQENRYKRHSVADPKSNTYYNGNKESSSHMYGSMVRRQTEICAIKENSRSGGYVPNLQEDQRYVSQCDFKKVAEVKGTSIRQEPPPRTVSTTILEVNEKEPPKSNGMGSPCFFKKSSKKIKSLLNKTERKEGSPKLNNITQSPKRDSISDTTLSEDEQHNVDGEGKLHGSSANSTKSTDSARQRRVNGKLSMKGSHFSDHAGKSSAPRFSTEELHYSSPASGEPIKTQGLPSASAQNERLGLTRDSWRRDQGGENRLYSRYEPFCAIEDKRSPPGQSTTMPTNVHSTERHNSAVISKGSSSSEHHNHTDQQTQGHHDNKLGRFMQRVGNFIHKNK